jgi:hypothetical protein
MYNIYLIKLYNDSIRDDKIRVLLKDQTDIFTREMEKTLKYDKHVFSQKIDFSMEKIERFRKPKSEMYKIKLARDENSYDAARKFYSDNFQPIKEAHDELEKFEKYLNIFDTIYTMGQETRPEYAKFLNEMKEIIEELNGPMSYMRDNVIIANRWCLSIQQYYRFNN